VIKPGQGDCAGMHGLSQVSGRRHVLSSFNLYQYAQTHLGSDVVCVRFGTESGRWLTRRSRRETQLTDRLINNILIMSLYWLRLWDALIRAPGFPSLAVHLPPRRLHPLPRRIIERPREGVHAVIHVVVEISIPFHSVLCPPSTDCRLYLNTPLPRCIDLVS
jgi:hypothetical protein